MQKYFLFFVSLSVSLLSCSKTDTTKPTAELLSPADADTFYINDTIPFTAAYSDNEELNQYRVEMKNNFAELEDSLPAWKFVVANALTGTQDTVSSELIIPDTIYKGNYLLITKCVDTEGNEAAADTSRITIQ
ncbi:MAG: DUF4625 domain-containing protein [Bacteroidia bacterium]